MVFQVQPSGKKKKILGRRQRRSSYQNYQQAIANTDEAAAHQPGTAPNQAEEPAADPIPPLPKKRKDDNWREARAVKSAKAALTRETTKSEARLQESAASQAKLKQTEERVKELQRSNFLEKKFSRAQAIKTEEEHKIALTELNDKFVEDLDNVYGVAAAETMERIAEEELRINTE